MSTIVTRAGKGAPLTNTELDNNFTNLNTDKLEINAALGTPVSVTLTNATGLPTAGLVDNAVTDAKLRDSAGLSVIGRGANSTGDPADIVAGTNHQVLRRDGSSLAFGAVDLSSNQAVTGTLPVNQGGTGITSFGSGVATWLGTPSSANLAAAVTDETGTGALVFATNATLVNPALGTPASGVVTNLTGTASININGTVGATTPAAGVFTTLTTSGAETSFAVNQYVRFGSAVFARGDGSLNNFLYSGTTSLTFRNAADNANLMNLSDSGNLGIGISPASVRVHSNIATSGVPATSGTTQTNGALRLSATSATSGILDFGVNGTAPWIQATDATDLSQTYNILLNPNGGNVGIGIASPTGRLDVKAPTGNGLISITTGTTTADSIRISGGGSTTNWLEYRGYLGHVWFDNAAEAMRLTSTGLGIGTSSPRAKLDVNGSILSGFGDVSIGSQFTDGSGYFNGIKVVSGDRETQIIAKSGGAPDGQGITFHTGSGPTKRMQLDYSGNLGLGVTPSGWATPVGGSVIEMVQGASFASRSDQPGIYASLNCFHNGVNWIYKATAAASQYFQNAGAHSWSVAPSGTAGNAITFTQAMTLSAAGGLSIGTTTDAGAGNLLVAGGGGTGSYPLKLTSTGCDKLRFEMNTAGAGSYIQSTDNAETVYEPLGIYADGLTINAGTGNYLRMASGTGGIQFNGDTAAANALDDYEEGTWTPIDASGAGLTFTVGGTPRYVKIGRLVFFTANDITFPSTANANPASIGGLPFTVDSNNSGTLSFVATTTNASAGLAVASAANIFLYANGTVSASTNADLSLQQIYGISGCYQVA